MNDKAGKVLVSGWDDEWYQEFFTCAECGCRFMTYLDNTLPHYYCPNCGVKFIKEETGDDCGF